MGLELGLSVGWLRYWAEGFEWKRDEESLEKGRVDGAQAGGERSPGPQLVADHLGQQVPVTRMWREVADCGVRLQANPQLPEMQTHNPSATSEFSEPRGTGFGPGLEVWGQLLVPRGAVPRDHEWGGGTSTPLRGGRLVSETKAFAKGFSAPGSRGPASPPSPGGRAPGAVRTASVSFVVGRVIRPGSGGRRMPSAQIPKSKDNMRPPCGPEASPRARRGALGTLQLGLSPPLGPRAAP